MPRIASYNYSITGATLYGPLAVLDNQSSPATILTMPWAGNQLLQFNYSVVRNGFYRVGRLLVVTDGTTVTITDDNAIVNDVQVVFNAMISGSNLLLQYTSGNLGVAGSFKYYLQDIT